MVGFDLAELQATADERDMEVEQDTNRWMAPEIADILTGIKESKKLSEEAEEKFGFLLEAFKYGAPPHGGIAFGWDRICALLTGAASIREVIAFPKTGGGFDPLTSAPAPITAAQRKEAGVDAVPEPPA